MVPSTPLKRVLVDEGRRQDWLARRTGIDPADISRIVRGMHPGERRARLIADALGRQIGELWPHLAGLDQPDQPAAT